MPTNVRPFPLLRWLGSVAVYAGLTLALLCMTYPVWNELAHDSTYPYSWSAVLTHYSQLALVTTFLGACIAALVPQLFVRKLPVLLLSIVQGLLALGLLWWFAYRMGTALNVQPDWIEGMRSPFFSELQFIAYAYWIAIPMSIASGLLRWWWHRDSGEVRSKEITELHLL